MCGSLRVTLITAGEEDEPQGFEPPRVRLVYQPKTFVDFVGYCIDSSETFPSLPFPAKQQKAIGERERERKKSITEFNRSILTIPMSWSVLPVLCPEWFQRLGAMRI